MSEEEVKKILMQIRNTEHEIKRKAMQREELRSCLLPGGIRYDLEKVQTSPEDKMQDVETKIDELEREIVDLACKKARMVIETGKMIEKLHSETEKTVLTGFYIAEKPMSKLADELKYARRGIYHVRKRGIANLSKIL